MDKKAVRQALIEKRLNMPNRLERAEQLQQVLRFWLTEREDTVIGAYWPIKGEFDPLPALHRWKEDGALMDEPLLRRIGLAGCLSVCVAFFIVFGRGQPEGSDEIAALIAGALILIGARGLRSRLGRDRRMPGS